MDSQIACHFELSDTYTSRVVFHFTTATNIEGGLVVFEIDNLKLKYVSAVTDSHFEI